MRIRPDMLKCVVFLCRERLVGGQTKVVPVATGFLISVQVTPHTFFHYLVTSRHVIEKDPLGRLIVRANTKAGNSRYIPTEASAWVLHDQADIALLPFSVDDDLDIRSVHHPSHFIGGPGNYRFTTVLREKGSVVGEQVHRLETGDQIATIGLFIEDYGEASNLPIARMGHIARMPAMVNTPRWEGDGFRSAAYLAEFFAYPGLSGSPVFWFSQIEVTTPVAGNFMSTESHLIPGLVGCVNGYVPRPQKAEVTGDVLGTITTEINTGIATVTPCSAIVELLNHPELARQRIVLAPESGKPTSFVKPAVGRDKIHAIHEPWYSKESHAQRREIPQSQTRSDDAPAPTESGPRLGGVADL